MSIKTEYGSGWEAYFAIAKLDVVSIGERNSSKKVDEETE